MVMIMACLTCFHFFLLKNSLKQTVLELTIEHVLKCLEKLFGADDIIKNGKVDSDNLRCANRTVQNSTKRRRLSPTNECLPTTGGE